MSTLNIHKRQLFHWIGWHLEQDRTLSGQDRTDAYVAALRGSMQDGLWLTPKGETLELRDRSYPLTRPMVCFTENRLSEARFHATRYGRLGLGFPKRFVLAASGKPVSYVHARQGDLFTRYLLEVLEESASGGFGKADELDFLAHFTKPLGVTRSRPSPASRRAKSTVPAGPPGAKVRRRSYGPRMLFQSEGEWRVVETKDALGRRSVRFQVTPERTYLKYRVGEDLMTIVFPDRRTQQAALEAPDIAAAIDQAQLPVNVFHLDEVGEL